MKTSNAVSFTKAPECPSTNILLSLLLKTLSPEIMTLIKHHLATCDFCCAELPLLAHYEVPKKGECKAPEIPINLRILAESLLGKSARARKVSGMNDAVKYGLLVAEG
jgi:hypothetical protein